MSLLLNSNSLKSSSSVSIVNFEQLNARQDDNDTNNDDYDEDVDMAEFLMNLILFF